MDKEDVRNALDKASYYAEFIPGFSPNGSEWCPAKCPFHDDAHPSASVNCTTGAFKCRACDLSLDVFGFHCRVTGMQFKDALEDLAERAGVDTGTRDRGPEITFDYHDDAGKVLYQVVRRPGKKFLQRRPDGIGGWIWKLGDVKPVLYRLPDLLKSVGPVHLTEGEKDAETLMALGFNATTNSGGAGSFPEDQAKHLRGREVVLHLDNDSKGIARGKALCRMLDPFARSIRVVEYRDLGAGGDVSDFIAAGGTREDIEGRAREALYSDEWMQAIRDEAGPTSAKSDDEPPAEKPFSFPLIIGAREFTMMTMEEPEQVIVGVLHRGSKAVFGGPSKAYKTWNLMDMGMAVASGEPWWNFPTTKGKVLYVNFELQPFAIHRRLKKLAEDRNIGVPENLKIWNLRGYATPLDKLIPELLRQIEGDGYALVIPDPIYKTLMGRNENDAGDIGSVCNEIEAVAVETGAAVAFGAHYAKGNAAGKEHIDRVSGSGVWARDPDSIITATAHEEEGAFTVEMTLRNFQPQDPFVVRWEYPRMRRDVLLDPAKLKNAAGRPAENSVSDIMQYLSGAMTTTEWMKECRTEGGVSERAFYRLLKVANDGELVIKDGKSWRKK